MLAIGYQAQIARTMRAKHGGRTMFQYIIYTPSYLIATHNV